MRSIQITSKLIDVLEVRLGSLGVDAPVRYIPPRPKEAEKHEPLHHVSHIHTPVSHRPDPTEPTEPAIPKHEVPVVPPTASPNEPTGHGQDLWTDDMIKTRMKHDEAFLEKCLMTLYDRDQRLSHRFNFMKFDREILSSFGTQISRGRRMSVNQVGVMRKALPKYTQTLRQIWNHEVP